MLAWLPDVSRSGKTLEYLGTLVNVIKYNAAYVDEEVTNGLMQYVINFFVCVQSIFMIFFRHISVLCCSTNQEQVVFACLNILDTIVAYSNLPPESLPQFVGALCRTVNGIAYTQMSWKVCLPNTFTVLFLQLLMVTLCIFTN